MTASALLASDLDQTLIYSRRHLPTDAHEFSCVEIYEGRPISYMTETARVLLTDLARRHIVVPTTTRTVEQYQRIMLPGGPYPIAITTNGGDILIDGAPDPSWRSGIQTHIAAECAGLDDVVAELLTRIDDNWVRNMRTAGDLFCYLVVDEALTPTDFEHNWQQWCAPRGWGVSRQGRKIYTVPQVLCKSRAIAEVRRRLLEEGQLATDAPVFAAGDGSLDAELLQYADLGIRPAHGELHQLDWHRDNIIVTTTSGARAGEEILRWFTNTAASVNGGAQNTDMQSASSSIGQGGQQ
ncbi:Predicted hydrolase (HAD superfamily) [Mycobacteroides abscessus subsp. abscessus]|uniref:HAD family hydrolase n=1 Tax=Mycobacteroides abscessus TaxID=36809 RepID=UPI00092C287D|nr:HAD family hydrolase [Mycobacteroides abscessus]SIH20311.1 Predicted hydrolase (HAD superfamily) [Mycobacteroides abscessus subsp. abscessus]